MPFTYESFNAAPASPAAAAGPRSKAAAGARTGRLRVQLPESNDSTVFPNRKTSLDDDDSSGEDVIAALAPAITGDQSRSRRVSDLVSTFSHGKTIPSHGRPSPYPAHKRAESAAVLPLSSKTPNVSPLRKLFVRHPKAVSESPYPKYRPPGGGVTPSPKAAAAVNTNSGGATTTTTTPTHRSSASVSDLRKRFGRFVSPRRLSPTPTKSPWGMLNRSMTVDSTVSDSAMYPAPPPQPMPPPSEDGEDEDDEDVGTGSDAGERAQILSSARESRHSVLASTPEEVGRTPNAPRRKTVLRPSMSRHKNRALPKPPGPAEDWDADTEEVVAAPLSPRKVIRPSMSRHRDRALPVPPSQGGDTDGDEKPVKSPPKPRRKLVPSLSRHRGRKVPLPPPGDGATEGGPATLPRRKPTRTSGLFLSLSRRKGPELPPELPPKPLPPKPLASPPEEKSQGDGPGRRNSTRVRLSISPRSNANAQGSQAKFRGSIVVANVVDSDTESSLSNPFAPVTETVVLRPVKQNHIPKTDAPVTESVVLRAVNKSDAQRSTATSMSSNRDSVSSQGSNASGTKAVTKTPPVFWRGKRLVLPPTQEFESLATLSPPPSKAPPRPQTPDDTDAMAPTGTRSSKSSNGATRASHSSAPPPLSVRLSSTSGASKSDAAQTPISTTGTLLPPVPRKAPPSSMQRTRAPEAQGSDVLQGVATDSDVKTPEMTGSKSKKSATNADNIRRLTSVASSAVVPADYEDPAFSDISSPSMGADIAPDLDEDDFPSLDEGFVIGRQDDPFFAQQRQHAFSYTLPVSRMNNKKPKPGRPVPLPPNHAANDSRRHLMSRTVPRKALNSRRHVKSMSVAAIDIGPRMRDTFRPSNANVPLLKPKPRSPTSAKGFGSSSRKIPSPRRPNFAKSASSMPRMRSTSHQVFSSVVTPKHSASASISTLPVSLTPATKEEKPKSTRRHSLRRLSRSLQGRVARSKPGGGKGGHKKSRSIAIAAGFGSFPGRSKKRHKKSASSSTVGALGLHQQPRIDLKTLQERISEEPGALESVSEHKAATPSTASNPMSPPYWEDDSSDGELSDVVEGSPDLQVKPTGPALKITINARVAYIGNKSKLRGCHGKVVKKLRAGLVRVQFDDKGVGSKVLHKGQLRVAPLVALGSRVHVREVLPERPDLDQQPATVFDTLEDGTVRVRFDKEHLGEAIVSVSQVVVVSFAPPAVASVLEARLKVGDACEIQTSSGEWEPKWRVDHISPTAVVVTSVTPPGIPCAQRALIDNLVRRPPVFPAPPPKAKMRGNMKRGSASAASASDHSAAFYDGGSEKENNSENPAKRPSMSRHMHYPRKPKPVAAASTNEIDAEIERESLSSSSGAAADEHKQNCVIQ